MSTRIGLNTKLAGNYSFFCPLTKLHLVLTNPVGVIDRVSPSIIRGIKSGTLIDIDGKIDLNNETLIDNPVSKKNIADKKVVEQEEAVQEQETVQEEKKSSRKSTTKKSAE